MAWFSRPISAFMALLAMLAMAGSAAEARELVSTAQARWTSMGRNFESVSNTNIIKLGDEIVRLRTYHPTPGGTVLPVSEAFCGTPDVGASARQSMIALQLTDRIRPGERLVVELTSNRLNLDPTRIESIAIWLGGEGADSEVVTLLETSPDSGVFRSIVRTQDIKGGLAPRDCTLSVVPGEVLQLAYMDTEGRPIPAGTVDVLIDPFGLIVDSQDGRPVSGVRISLVDANGQPAKVFAADGLTAWPSTMVSGETVIDGAGVRHVMQEGEYRFPLAAQGKYRLVVEPPPPYSAPSNMSRAHLAGLTRLGDLPLEISDASFGKVFDLIGPEPLRVDIPIDRPSTALALTKSASRAIAQPGDAVVYSILVSNPDAVAAQREVVVEDLAPAGLRLLPETLRLNGVAVDPATLSPMTNGRGFTLRLGRLEPGALHRLTYVMRVREDAAPGQVENIATISDSRGMLTKVSAAIRIDRDIIAARMTIIGRVTLGQCGMPQRIGIPGVRVMLEDGSFAITDADGRYHFEGVTPGTHVVQIARETMPEGAVPQLCEDSVRSGGSAISRFVIGQGGSLAVADFSARSATVPLQTAPVPAEPRRTAPVHPAPPAPMPSAPAGPGPEPARTDAESRARRATGADIDWMAIGDGPDDFLFPAPDHNPRAPAVRAVIRHRPGHQVVLRMQGQPVSELAFDGTTVSPDGRYAISIWRGIALTEGQNLLEAQISGGPSGAVTRLQRDIHYSGPAVKAELVRERSHLVADGRSRPVIAVRLTDRDGKPVRSGLAGEFSLNAPYESAAALEALQLSQLSGSGMVSPRWVVEGDDGIALIELAPTMVSGALRLGFTFVDGDVRREQRIDDWITPGDQPWTLIALAEGALGSADIGGLMERLGTDGREQRTEGRVALYAKGQILGKFLLTAAYDSAKQRDDQRLLGTIDPNSYYTVFGDGSDRRFDAASREKLYLRIESASFNALYGDFITGFDQTDLAAYRRTATGVRAEARDGKWHADAFAANISSSQRRDEIQGNGLSGPYRLSTRAILPNSERIVLEVRDRFRSEVIVSRQELTRFVDYDIDLLAGTVRFRQPILSRDPDLNPQFIVIDYEVDEGRGESALNGGIRADYTGLDGRLIIGTTVISDRTNDQRGTLAAMDVRARLGADTELRGEFGATRIGDARATSWQVEAEHHSGKWDMLAYARSIAADFGIGQQNLAEKGRRKFGLDTRYALNDAVAITASAWRDDSLVDTSQRHAVQMSGVLRTQRNDWRLGLSHFADRLADGSRQNSTVAEAAVTRRMLGDRLELSLSSSVAFGSANSADLPARHRVGARYALNSSARLLVSYEIANGAGLSARTFSGGVELTPWTGGRVVTSIGQSNIAEQGRRTYAAAGLAQSFQVTQNLGLDITVDGNRKLAGRTIVPVNPAQPLASGGQLSQDAGLFENFTAVTLGANWRKDSWSATGRGEWRDGALATRKGATLGLIRQLGEGSVLGSGFTWTQAKGTGSASGTSSAVMDMAIAAAFRPAASSVALLTKLEYRSDRVTGAVAGQAGPVGGSALTITGDGQARRFIGSMSANWSPRGKDEASGRSELGVFIGVRHSLDAVAGYDLRGTSVTTGIDARHGLGSKVELGLSATVRANIDDGSRRYAIGPSIGVSPVKGTMVTLGYNFKGFDDPDFEDSRPSRKGLFVNFRAKIDQDSFAFLRRNGR